MKKKIEVDGLLKPVRADIFCSQIFEEISRSKLKIGLKSFFINSKQKKISSIVNNGDIIELEWIDPIPKFAKPQNIKLNIIYEDKDWIVVNKPAKMVTHPANGNWNRTLVNALNFYRCNISNIKDEFSFIVKNQRDIENNNSISENDCNAYKPEFDELYRLGIVHRLDKETSGLIITARNFQTQKYLKQEFKNRKITKYYLAILKGVPKKKQDKIKTLVFRSKKNRKKFDCIKVDSNKMEIKNKTQNIVNKNSNGKIAISSYKVLKENNGYSLVVFRIFTGRTHQIRLHSKFIHCPVLGDSLYGKKQDEKSFLMLHSYQLILNGEKKAKFKARIPKHFKDAIKRLGLC